LYITINFLLFLAWYIFLFRQKGLLSFTDRITGTFVLGLTQIIVAEMLLGIVIRKLYAMPLFFLNVFVSSVVLLIASRLGKKQAQRTGQQETHLNVVREMSGKFFCFMAEVRSDLILSVIVILFLAAVCWIIFLGYLFPSYTWDALWYHLPIVGYIMQSGAIQEVPNHSFIDQFINIFPKNTELFFLWNIIFLRSDVITDLSQLFFTLAGIFAVYSIAVKMNVSSRCAIYSALLFFFAPIIILQSTTNYVDIAVSVLFLIAINFLIDNGPGRDGFESFSAATYAGHEYQQKRNVAGIMAGLTTGILLGSKGSGPLFTALLSAAFIVRESLFHYRTSGKQTVLKLRIIIISFRSYLLYFFIPVFIMGGYWYIKNWIVYGNPVYPMEISFFNTTVFKGLYQGLIEPAPQTINELHPFARPLYVWLENIDHYLYDSRLGGLGPIWFILLLPAVFFSAVYSAIKRNFRFLFISMLIAAAFLMHPRNWNPRYVIFITGLGAISFGITLDYFRKKGTVLRAAALFLVAYTCIISNSPCVTPEQIRKFLQLHPRERTIANHAPFNIDLHARQEYGYWIWISRNIAEGDTLGYTFEPLFLSPLWNSAFSSRITYVKSDAYKEWLKKLTENKVTYILVRKNSEEDIWIETEKRIFSSVGWMAALKEKFKIVYADDNYKIARVMHNEG